MTRPDSITETDFIARGSDGTPNGATVVLTGFTATDPREVLSLTTTLLRGETLMDDGYTIRPTSRPDVFIVTGRPRITRTGRTELHGPYTVDVRGGTCTCGGFAGRGACKHLEGVRLAISEGRVVGASGPLSRGLLGLVAEGGRLYCRYLNGKPMIVAFRREEDAECERAAARLIDGEPVMGLTQVGSLTLDALMGDGRYAGLLLVTGAQEVPIWFGDGRGR
jgi:hypothetical protein